MKVSKFRIFMFSIYLKVKHLFISFKGFNEFHLGDRVIYSGMDYIITDGKRSDSNGNQLWTISLCASNIPRPEYHVLASSIKHKFNWNTIKNRLFSHYNWWKTYWYKIDLGKMVEDYCKRKGR